MYHLLCLLLIIQLFIWVKFGLVLITNWMTGARMAREKTEQKLEGEKRLQIFLARLFSTQAFQMLELG